MADGTTAADLRLFLRYVVARCPGRVIAAALTCLMAAISAVGTLIVSAWLVGVVGEPAVTRQEALIAALLLGVVVAIGQSMSFSVNMLCASLGLAVENALRTDVLVAAMGPSPPVRDHAHSPDRVSSSGYTPELVVMSLGLVTVRVLSAVLATALLAAYSWWLPVVVLAALLAVRHARHRQFMATARPTITGGPAQDRVRYLVDLSLAPGVAKEWRLFGLHRFIFAELRGQWRTLAGSLGAGRHEARALVFGAAVLLGGSATLVFVLVAAAGAAGQMPFATALLLVVATLFGQSLTTYGSADLAVASGAADLAAAIRFAASRPVEPERTAGGNEVRTAPELVVAGVRYTYPGAETPALNGLDLRIAAGRCTAIVGPNGAGKSTVLHLLQGFGRPRDGAVLVDGRDLETMDLDGWQRGLAVVRQDFLRYPLSVRDNIALDGAPEPGAVESAAARAGLTDALAELPDGLDTVLDPGGGAELSGGQWQRVALARMLYATDRGATTVLLDEPTAALDARAELRTFTTLLAELAGRTVVLVSHRFASVRLADHIAVVANGRVIEQGDHDTLMQLDGYYAAAFRTQADRYRTEQPR